MPQRVKIGLREVSLGTVNIKTTQLVIFGRSGVELSGPTTTAFGLGGSVFRKLHFYLRPHFGQATVISGPQVHNARSVTVYFKPVSKVTTNMVPHLVRV